MILNNKSTNPIGYTISLETDEQRQKVEENKAKNILDPLYKPPMRHIAVFCGVTGNHPKELLNSPAFIEDCSNERPDEGIEIICEDSKIDNSRIAMNTSECVKLPDFDVVDFCTKIGDDKLKKKQIHTIESIFKIKTLEEISKQEKRSDVIAAIDRQFKSIETSITKNTRAR